MADRDQLEQALRAADKAGDKKAATALAAALSKTPKAVAPAGPGEKDILGEALVDKNPLVGVVEAGMSIGTSMLASVVSGFAGMGKAALPGESGAGAEAVQNVQDTLTYQPRTEAGKVFTKTVSAPFEALASGADAAGAKVAEVTGSPALGAGLNTLIQAAPMALGLRGKAKPGASGAEATAALREASTLAERVVTKAGVKWSELPRAARVRLTELAQDAEAFGEMTPEMIQRAAKMESLPVPIEKATKGQYSRDPVQLRTEGIVSQTDAGKPIRETYLDQNEKLTQNLDVLKDRTGARAKTTEQTGEKVTGALKLKERQSERGVSKLYKEAERKGEMEGTVSIDPLTKYLMEHDDPSQVAYATSKLKSLKLVSEDEFGHLMPTHEITLNQLEGIRKAANVVSRTDQSTKGHYAGELVRKIDEMIPESAGGEAYKAARAARKEHAMQFEEPKAISQLVDNTSRTDRKVALEDVWGKTVLSGSIEDLRKVRTKLLEDTDRGSRVAGRKAWKEIAGQTAQHIKDEATKSATTNERGAAELSPAKLKQTLDKIGDEKLEVIFGKTASKQLRNLSETASDLKTKPPSRLSGSDTVVNGMVMLEKILGFVAGDVGRGAVRAASKLKESGSAGRQTREALRSPFDKEEVSQPMARGTLRDALIYEQAPAVGERKRLEDVR